MHGRVGRLVEAGDRLKSFVERSCEALGGEHNAMVLSWVAAVEHLLDDAVQATDERPPPPRELVSDFDYLAFDSETLAVIGYGSRAIFALQYADEASPESPITILYAGILGRWIWDVRFTLDMARPLLGGWLPAGGRPPEVDRSSAQP